MAENEEGNIQNHAYTFLNILSLFLSAFVPGSKRKIEDEVDATQNAPKRVSMSSVFRFFLQSAQEYLN